jgi:hypothetical protein
MRLFIETAETTELSEIFNFEIESALKNLALQAVAGVILALDLPASEGFEYIAIMNAAGATEIRYVQDRKSCDPWRQGREQKIGRGIGLFACFFQGTAIDPKEIPDFVRWHVLRNWIELSKDAIREISLLVHPPN